MTSTAIAVVTDGSSGDQMRAALFSVPLIDNQDEAFSATERLKSIRLVMSALKVATSDRIAAMRLECALIRRLGQLGGSDSLGNNGSRAMCRDMALLTDEAFTAFLEAIDVTASPITVWRLFRPEPDWKRDARIRNEDALTRHNQRLLEDGEYATSYSKKKQGQISDHEASVRRNKIWQATAEILETLDLGDAPFTTQELSEKIHEELIGCPDNQYEWADDPDLGPLLALAAREGMRATATKDGEMRRITYYDEELGRVRVPWHIASINHLIANADYAQQQADELQSKANEMAELRDKHLRLLREGEDNTTLLVALQRRTIERPLTK